MLAQGSAAFTVRRTTPSTWLCRSTVTSMALPLASNLCLAVKARRGSAQSDLPDIKEDTELQAPLPPSIQDKNKLQLQQTGAGNGSAPGNGDSSWKSASEGAELAGMNVRSSRRLSWDPTLARSGAGSAAGGQVGKQGGGLTATMSATGRRLSWGPATSTPSSSNSRGTTAAPGVPLNSELIRAQHSVFRASFLATDSIPVHVVHVACLPCLVFQSLALLCD